VSHQPERKHKNCLNCGVLVKGRYCHRCGQENIVTKQSFEAFAKHFIYDILHFDGKFFHTLKDLLLKPGQVAKAYVSGKRMYYLDPVRMYLFTSAVFFLVFFSIAKPKVTDDPPQSMMLANKERIMLANYLLALRKYTGKPFRSYMISKLLDTSLIIILNKDSIHVDSLVFFKGASYKMQTLTKAELIKKDEQASWLERLLKKKAHKLALANSDRLASAPVLLLNEFVHNLPYLLFISLPFFALILKLLYIRHPRFYYSDHIIFTLYHYIFSFFLMLINAGFSGLANLLHTSIFAWLSAGLAVYWLFFLYKAMRNFYGQNRWKTILKFFIVNILGLLSLIFLAFIFLLISAIDL
jgi:hypothetical protein